MQAKNSWAGTMNEANVYLLFVMLNSITVSLVSGICIYLSPSFTPPAHFCLTTTPTSSLLPVSRKQYLDSLYYKVLTMPPLIIRICDSRLEAGRAGYIIIEVLK